MEPPRDLRDGFVFPLRDGRRAFLSPVRPDDRERVENGFAVLSPTSRRFRFFRLRGHLTDEELRYFTEVDQVHHVAWGALDPSGSWSRGIGIGRFIRGEDDPAEAEVAITVADDYQRRGLGTLLLGVLSVHAEALGVDRFKAYVLPDNRVAIGWLFGLGAELLSDDEYLEFVLRNVSQSGERSRTPARVEFDRLCAALRPLLARWVSPSITRAAGR